MGVPESQLSVKFSTTPQFTQLSLVNFQQQLSFDRSQLEIALNSLKVMPTFVSRILKHACEINFPRTVLLH